MAVVASAAAAYAAMGAVEGEERGDDEEMAVCVAADEPTCVGETDEHAVVAYAEVMAEQRDSSSVATAGRAEGVEDAGHVVDVGYVDCVENAENVASAVTEIGDVVRVEGETHALGVEDAVDEERHAGGLGFGGGLGTDLEEDPEGIPEASPERCFEGDPVGDLETSHVTVPEDVACGP